MKFIHKHSFLLRDVVLSALLAFGIIALMVIAVGSMAVNYDRPDLVSPAFSNNYNKLNSLLDDLESTRTATTSTAGLSFIGTFNIAFNSIFQGKTPSKLSISVLESVLVGISLNIEFLNNKPPESVKAMYDKLLTTKAFSPKNLREGIAGKDKVIARLNTSKRIFSGHWHVEQNSNTKYPWPYWKTV